MFESCILIMTQCQTSLISCLEEDMVSNKRLSYSSHNFYTLKKKVVI